MPDPVNSGKVVAIKSDPNGFTIQPPGDPLPPTIAYVDVSAGALTIATGAFYASGEPSVSVTGRPAARSRATASIKRSAPLIRRNSPT